MAPRARGGPSRSAGAEPKGRKGGECLGPLGWLGVSCCLYSFHPTDTRRLIHFGLGYSALIQWKCIYKNRWGARFGTWATVCQSLGKVQTSPHTMKDSSSYSSAPCPQFYTLLWQAGHAHSKGLILTHLHPFVHLCFLCTSRLHLPSRMSHPKLL